MKSCGVVVEYNPFHNGHYYHLQEAKKQTQADCLIAVMSGNFLQRGEPAIVSKWTRTEMALHAGADLVIELPYPFATAYAPNFAFGSISLLEAVGADYFCFGSESGEIDSLMHTAQVSLDQAGALQKNIQSYLKEGLSYPRALGTALQNLQSLQNLDITSPNNILGLEYIKTVLKYSYKIKPFTIFRKHAGYHDPSLGAGNIASATAIRKEIMSSGLSDILSSYLPDFSWSLLKNAFLSYGLQSWEKYYSFLRYRILSSSPQDLERIYEVEEGLENRIIKAAKEAKHFHEYMELLKTKRYTWTRLQRASMHILNNATKAEMRQFLSRSPSYIRILGMSSKGQRYVNENKKNWLLPTVSTVSKCDDPMLKREVQTTIIYGIGSEKTDEFMKKEFTTPPICIPFNS